MGISRCMVFENALPKGWVESKIPRDHRKAYKCGFKSLEGLWQKDASVLCICIYIYTKAMDVCTNKHQTVHECLGLVSKTFENQCFSSRVRLIVIPSRAINKGTGRWLGFAAAKLACAWENLLSELAEFEPWDMFKICGPSRSTSS